MRLIYLMLTALFAVIFVTLTACYGVIWLIWGGSYKPVAWLIAAWGAHLFIVVPIWVKLYFMVNPDEKGDLLE